jgi:CPA1 family monovalent cation:H+ antiporter
MDRLDRTPHVHYGVFAGAILLTVILARVGWLITYNFSLRAARHTLGVAKPVPLKNSILVSWCGMRGIVTLATALALPADFPYRDLIVLTAFAVVLGTLVVQGLTLRTLAMVLGVDDESPVGNEVRAGRVEMFKAALRTLDHTDTGPAEALRREYADVLRKIDGSIGRSEREHQAELALRGVARTAARERLIALREAGAIGEAAFQELEGELDLIELNADLRSRW